jgi:hypothetical protein
MRYGKTSRISRILSLVKINALTKSLRDCHNREGQTSCCTEEEDTHHDVSYADGTSLITEDSFVVTLGAHPPDDWSRMVRASEVTPTMVIMKHRKRQVK